MDDFSWFVGLYEGEGSFGSRLWKKKTKNKVYTGSGIYLTIKMTDEDVIAKAAEFLGQKYSEVERKDRESKGYKRCYRVRQMGGVGEGCKLYDLMMKMKPHLSKRRQEQIEHHISRALELNNQKVQ